MALLRATRSLTATRNTCGFQRKLFTYFLAVSILYSALVDATSTMVVSRKIEGDHFTNPRLTKPRSCDEFDAICINDLVKSCGECRCHAGNETYRFDLKKCVPRTNLDNYSGCLYIGLKNHRLGILDARLTTLDLTKRNNKNIQAPLRMPKSVDIRCHIANTSGYLDRRGDWTPLAKIADALRVDVSIDASASIRRYLNLNWEGVENYSGMLIKLDIVCHADNGIDSEENCFLFKAKGRHFVDGLKNTTPTLKATTVISSGAVKLPRTTQKEQTTSPFTKYHQSTVVNPDQSVTYSIPQTIIIGISAGVALVILIIIILAVCCVRTRVRKLREPPSIISNEPPKVHFTAQTRFSLIRESAQIETIEPEAGDYACLQNSRESYDPYCSLKKDDVDLNVIDQVLKEAISIESVQPSSETRYSYRLSGNEMVIETVPPRTPDFPKYHVLEDQEDDNDEPDYEEVSSDDDDYPTITRRLETKPPLPDREYPGITPDDAVDSDC